VDVGRQNVPPGTAGDVENLVPLRSEALNEPPDAAELNGSLTFAGPIVGCRSRALTIEGKVEELDYRVE
jgi:hypothetical protein